MSLAIQLGRRTLTFALLLALSATAAMAQDLSDFEVDPVEATEFNQGNANQGGNGQFQAQGLVIPAGTYRSDSLGGEFEAQWMKMTIPNFQGGQSFVFWGARAIKLDNNSPLRGLTVQFNNGQAERFQVGDVITRMDEIKINDGMFRDNQGVWQVVELDEHFGPTTFRWIKSGHSHVNVSKVTLTNNNPPRNPPTNPGPVPVAP